MGLHGLIGGLRGPFSGLTGLIWGLMGQIWGLIGQIYSQGGLVIGFGRGRQTDEWAKTGKIVLWNHSSSTPAAKKMHVSGLCGASFGYFDVLIRN